MVTEPRPSLSARAIAAAATRSTLRPWRGPRRESGGLGSRQSSCRVRAGSPPLLCSVGIGTFSRILTLYAVHCTEYSVDCCPIARPEEALLCRSPLPPYPSTSPTSPPPLHS